MATFDGSHMGHDRRAGDSPEPHIQQSSGRLCGLFGKLDMVEEGEGDIVNLLELISYIAKGTQIP